MMDKVLVLVYLTGMVCGAPDPYLLLNNGFNSGLRAAYPYPYFLYNQPGQTGGLMANKENQQSDLLNNILTAIYSNQPYVLSPWSNINTILGYPQSHMMTVEPSKPPIVLAKDSAYTTSFTSSNSEKQDSRPRYFTVSNKPQNHKEHQ